MLSWSCLGGYFGSAAAIAAQSGGQEGGNSEEVPIERPEWSRGTSVYQFKCPANQGNHVVSSAQCCRRIVYCRLLAVPVAPSSPRLWRRAAIPTPREQQAPAGQDAAKDAQKVDEYAEAQRALNGPAGNPECVWLGPPRGQPALARRHRYRLPPPRSLRPLRLPERPYPGGVSVPGSAPQHHRSEDPGQLQWTGAGLLDQSVAPKPRRAARRGRAEPRRRHASGPALANSRYFCIEIELGSRICCLEFAIAER